MKILTTFFFLALNTMLFGQSIQSFIAEPNVGTPETEIEVMADLVFPSGSCELANISFSQIDDTITVQAYHFMGVATYICSDSDTLNLGTFAPGTYTVIYNLYTEELGQWHDSDTTQFVIENVMGSVPLSSTNLFLAFPNPTQNQVMLKFNLQDEYFLTIRDLTGKLMKKISVRESQVKIDLSGFSSGLYFLEAQNSKSIQVSRLLIQK